jgi:hypothetical protein
MTTITRRSTHLSRYFAALRQQRGLRPGQLAALLAAPDPARTGGLIRSFELGGAISEVWLERLSRALQADPAELARCRQLDQQESDRVREQQRQQWQCWADELIAPVLIVRYIPGVCGQRPVPQAFCNSREQAESWCVDELRRCRAKGVLQWSRRQRTWFEQYGLSPRRQEVEFS